LATPTKQLLAHTLKTEKMAMVQKILLNHMRPHFNATPHCTKCETPPYFGKDLLALGGKIRTILAINLRDES